MSHRRRRKRRMEAEQGLIITSMVDMFTLLLTFLLNFVNPSDPASRGLLLPDSSATAAPGGGVVVTVSTRQVLVAASVVAALEGEGEGLRVAASVARGENGIEPLHAALRESIAALSPDADSGLVLQCDRAVPYAVVAEVLDTARRAGLERFRLVVDGETR